MSDIKPATLHCSILGTDADWKVIVPPDGVPIVNQSGRVIGYATRDGDSLVWCRTDTTITGAISVTCGREVGR